MRVKIRRYRELLRQAQSAKDQVAIINEVMMQLGKDERAKLHAMMREAFGEIGNEAITMLARHRTHMRDTRPERLDRMRHPVCAADVPEDE